MRKLLTALLVSLCLTSAIAKFWISPKAAAVFNPLTSIAGIQLYLDGNDATKFNGGSITNGTAVASWVDSTANGYTWSQGTAARKPIWNTNKLNGKSCVTFTDQVLAPSTEQYVNSGQPFEVVMVTKVISNNAGNSDMLFLANDKASHTVGMGFHATLGMILFGGGGANWINGVWAQGVDAGGSYHLWQWEYNGSGITSRSNFNFYYDRSSLGNPTANGTAVGDTTTSFLGNYSAGSDAAFDANITLCIFIVYQHLFSGGEQTNINSWAGTQFGI